MLPYFPVKKFKSGTKAKIQEMLQEKTNDPIKIEKVKLKDSRIGIAFYQTPGPHYEGKIGDVEISLNPLGMDLGWTKFPVQLPKGQTLDVRVGIVKNKDGKGIYIYPKNYEMEQELKEMPLEEKKKMFPEQEDEETLIWSTIPSVSFTTKKPDKLEVRFLTNPQKVKSKIYDSNEEVYQFKLKGVALGRKEDGTVVVIFY